MEFTNSLIKGKLVKRYKRFFADIKLKKEIVTAHCPNTGSMMGLLDVGNEVFISKNDDPKRKLKYTLEIIKVKKNLVGVNTHFANKIAFHGLSKNLVSEIKNNDTIIIEETDHFVISLGYVSNKVPTMGILHHPVTGKSWVAINNRGVFVQHHGGEIVPIQPPIKREEYVILVSAHRNDTDLCNIVVRQRERELNRPVQVRPVGSALKLAYLTEGIGDE